MARHQPSTPEQQSVRVLKVGERVRHILSELLARDDVDGTRRLYQMSTAWLVSVTWPVPAPRSSTTGSPVSGTARGGSRPTPLPSA